RLIGTTARDGFVVRVTAVGGDPVVGARGRPRGSGRSRVSPVAAHRQRPVAGDRLAFALAVVIQLPAHRAGRLGTEQATDRRLVLEVRIDRPRGRLLVGHDRRRRLTDRDRLIRATARDGVVVRVTAVGGDPVVG